MILSSGKWLFPVVENVAFFGRCFDNAFFWKVFWQCDLKQEMIWGDMYTLLSMLGKKKFGRGQFEIFILFCQKKKKGFDI